MKIVRIQVKIRDQMDAKKASRAMLATNCGNPIGPENIGCCSRGEKRYKLIVQEWEGLTDCFSLCASPPSLTTSVPWYTRPATSEDELAMLNLVRERISATRFHTRFSRQISAPDRNRINRIESNQSSIETYQVVCMI